MIDLQTLFESYGPVSVLAVISGLVFWRVIVWINKHDNTIEYHGEKIDSLQKELDGVHLSCPIKPERIEALGLKVTALELEDSKIDGDLKKINQHLKNLDDSMTEMRVDIKAILNHFAFKGMDG
jgi:predicted  nucleic acid-binding Zn-ribbon protein